MEYELYSKLTKGSGAALKKLQEQELPYAYFVCYQLTNDARTAATLVRRAWKETLEKIEGLGGCPRQRHPDSSPLTPCTVYKGREKKNRPCFSQHS